MLSLGNGARAAGGLTARPTFPWLFSAPVDLAAFLGSAAAALVFLAIGAQFNLLDETPEWTWVTGVLLIDVAHVYATAFRVYFDAAEFRRRRWLYLLTPSLAWLLGWALYSESPALFWRTLAYLAAFHFVRQQYGWVALYRAKADDHNRLGRIIDSVAIYLATVYPLIYWHTHLPRHFTWLMSEDFAPLPALAERIAAPLYWLALATYAARSAYRGLVLGAWNPGKDVVVGTTAVCWYLGIISYDSDYAFTVTNVIIHGAPYMVLVYWTSWPFRANPRDAEFQKIGQRWRSAIIFLATIWLLAYVEELAWDRGVWQERSWLFGSSWDWSRFRGLLVPLLAVPQATHYILDGFIWRRRSNPAIGQALVAFTRPLHLP